MQNLNFPINFQFKVTTFSNDFTATDASGAMVAYVRQKMFKLKEDIVIYADPGKLKVNYTIKADRWLDFSAAYAFFNADEEEFGKIVRKGWRSIWKAKYEIIDQHQELQYTITEENAWTKVFDSLLGGIPVLSMFTGYLFNPAYIVVDNDQNTIVRLKKEPSFFGRNFKVDKLGDMDSDDDDRILLGLMMLVLLERRRG